MKPDYFRKIGYIYQQPEARCLIPMKNRPSPQMRMLALPAPRIIYQPTRDGQTMAIVMEHNYMESATGRAAFRDSVREWLRAGEEASVQRMMMG